MDTSEVNIGPGQRRRRLAMGIVMIAAGMGLVAALVASGAGRGWRLLALFPFWIGALGVFQAREAT